MDVFGDLHGHRVAIVAVGEGEEDIGARHTSDVLDLGVLARSDEGETAEVVVEPVEGGGVDVDHGDVMTLVVEFAGKCGAESAATHDHNAHALGPALRSCIPL